MAGAVSLTFPDGSVRSYDAAITGAAIAESISKSLAKRRSPMRSMASCAILPIPSVTTAGSRSSRETIRARWNSSATTAPMCWPKPYRSCGPARR